MFQKDTSVVEMEDVFWQHLEFNRIWKDWWKIIQSKGSHLIQNENESESNNRLPLSYICTFKHSAEHINGLIHPLATALTMALSSTNCSPTCLAFSFLNRFRTRPLPNHISFPSTVHKDRLGLKVKFQKRMESIGLSRKYSSRLKVPVNVWTSTIW